MTRMTQAVPLDQHHPEIVLGVDTHKDVHVAAVITAAGAFVGSRSFPTTAGGYEQLLDWARTSGHVSRAGVECTGSYGAALSRYLRSQGITVFEVNQPDKATRRRRGKSDIIDAEAAAEQPAPPPTRSNSWPGGSSTSPRRSKTSPRGSPRSSRNTTRSSWPATTSAPTRPRRF